MMMDLVNKYTYSSHLKWRLRAERAEKMLEVKNQMINKLATEVMKHEEIRMGH